MRRIGNLWEDLISWENLYEAARKAALGKHKRPDVARFLLNLEPEVITLRRELENGDYLPGPYRTFTVLEPKTRLISAAPLRDRVVHHALTQILEPIFERRFTADSYACRAGFGAHRATAYSGGSRGHKAGVTPKLAAQFLYNQAPTLSSHLATTREITDAHGNCKQRGGTLPPGHYSCHYLAHHHIFKACIQLKRANDARAINSPFSPFPIPLSVLGTRPRRRLPRPRPCSYQSYRVPVRRGIALTFLAFPLNGASPKGAALGEALRRGSSGGCRASRPFRRRGAAGATRRIGAATA